MPVLRTFLQFQVLDSIVQMGKNVDKVYLKSLWDKSPPVLRSVSRAEPLENVCVPHQLDERLPKESERLNQEI